MNNKPKTLIFLIILSLIFLVFQNFALSTVIVFWIIILVYIITRKKNHFISLLLVLEILSLTRIFIISIILQHINSIGLIFILITLRVGEAVLGLAILVKLVRWSSTEFILSGLN